MSTLPNLPPRSPLLGSPTAQVAALEQLMVGKQAATATSVKALLEPALRDLQGEAAAEFINAAIPLCKRLHAHGRAFDALPLAQACGTLAERVDLPHQLRLRRQSAAAAGNLFLQTGDYAAAIAEHSRMLWLAEAADDHVDQARAWNNLGSVFMEAVAYSLALECFTRAYQRYSLGLVSSRYAALGNMAHCHLHLGNLRRGRAAARLALRYEESAAIRSQCSQDPYNAVVLRNNMVRLLVAANKKEVALPLAEQAYQLAAAAPSVLMDNLVNVMRAALDVAYGRIDIGITRLEHELQRVRHLPEPRTDTLMALVQAERAARRPGRAWVYWQELREHYYQQAPEQARQYLELCISSQEPPNDWPLSSLLEYATPMAEWDMFERLAQRASLAVYADSSHSTRVGELTRLLAIEAGYKEDEASELGLAARLHDIGLISVPGALLQIGQAGSTPKPDQEAAPASATNPNNAAEENQDAPFADLVQQHVGYGADLLSMSLHPRALLAAQIARYHHVPWQSRESPTSLCGTMVPKSARLTAIADAIDEILMRHLPDEALPSSAIAAETITTISTHLRVEAGRRFDPELVALCLRSLEGGLINRNLSCPNWWQTIRAQNLGPQAKAEAAKIRQHALTRARQLAPGEQTENFIRGVLEVCRQWSADQRWHEVLTLAHACQELAAHCPIELQSRVACVYGMAQADRFDLAGAIETHAAALQLAQQIKPSGDAVAQVWHNLGRVFTYGGAYELAIAAFSQVLTPPPAGLRRVVNPLTLHTAYINLAQCHFYRAETQAGLAAIQEAEILEVSPLWNIAMRDWLSLRYSQMCLLIQADQVNLAGSLVDEISQYTAFTPSPYAAMVNQAAGGIYAVARGDWKTGLLQMRQALDRSRTIPGALRDMLMSIMYAERLTGRPDHMIYYNMELKDLDKQLMIEAQCKNNAVLRAALWPD